MGGKAGGGGGHAVRALLPLSALYGAGVSARQALLSRGFSPSWALPCPVISVGNLTLGGNGKTPLVIWLAQRLAGAGVRPGVALRGYGGSYTSAAELVLAGTPGGARRWGDEACLLAAKLPGVPVAVGRERALAGLALMGQQWAPAPPVQAILLDDGFQHRRLLRSVDIVLLDAQAPLGNGRLIPAGPLREPAAALRRARIVILSRWSEASDAARREAEALARRLAPEAAIAHCSLCPSGVRPPAGDGAGGGSALDPAALSRDGCLAFCAIARPSSFASSLLAAGIRAVAIHPFRDHHCFTPLELEALEAEAVRRGAQWLITTEKDAARLDGWLPRSAKLAVLSVAAEVEPQEVVLGPVLSACRGV